MIEPTITGCSKEALEETAPWPQPAHDALLDPLRQGLLGKLWAGHARDRVLTWEYARSFKFTGPLQGASGGGTATGRMSRSDPSPARQGPAPLPACHARAVAPFTVMLVTAADTAMQSVMPSIHRAEGGGRLDQPGLHLVGAAVDDLRADVRAATGAVAQGR